MYDSELDEIVLLPYMLTSNMHASSLLLANGRTLIAPTK